MAKTPPPDDLPKSRTGRIPKWVIDEASGRRVETPGFRTYGLPDPLAGPVDVVRRGRRRALKWAVVLVTVNVVLVAALGTQRLGLLPNLAFWDEGSAGSDPDSSGASDALLSAGIECVDGEAVAQRSSPTENAPSAPGNGGSMGSSAPSGSGQVLKWRYVPEVAVVPGTLVDPQPKRLQDLQLNSSFVVQVTQNGEPVSGERIDWAVDDPTANVQSVFDTTDAQGMARAWFMAGTAAEQTVFARTTGASPGSVAFTVRRAESFPCTEGRYVTLYVSAPPIEKDVTAIWVGATPHTSPMRTYYQLTTVWYRDSVEGLYGGVQKISCDGFDVGLPEICSDSRGDLKGNLALFSMWDVYRDGGPPSRARPLSVPDSTKCQSFTGEGNGLQCFALLDWRPGERIEWKIENLTEREGDKNPIRVDASIDGGATWQHIGTFELPAPPDLAGFAAFNENYGGAPAPTCQQVEVRSITINSARFQAGDTWYSAERAEATGDLYPGALPCQNYEVVSEQGSGIRLTSGGTATWVNMREAAKHDPADLSLGFGFTSLEAAQRQWQWMDVATLDQP